MKILIMGLPGSGKTTLAVALAAKLRAVCFNADAIRQHINKDLGFSAADRVEQATRMGYLCDIVVTAGYHVIADFICPTEETRLAFGDAFIIYLDRVQSSLYQDTDAIFIPPQNANLIIPAGLSIQQELIRVLDAIYELNTNEN